MGYGVTMRPGASGGGQAMTLGRTQNVGAWREYPITVPASGRIGFAFAVSATAPAAVTLTCGAATVIADPRKTLVTAGAELSIVWLSGATPGAGTLRVTHAGTSGNSMYPIGPVVSCGMLPAELPASAGVVSTHDMDGRVIDHPGATEIALRDAAAGKWCGSYHGGHTGASTFYFDGTATDVSSVGGTWLMKDLAIRQNTEINGKLNCESLHAFRSADELIFQIALQGAMTISSGYMGMSTTREEWTELNGKVYPADNVVYSTAPTARVEQRIPGVGRRLVLQHYECNINGVARLPISQVQVSPGNYAKPRLGIIDGGATLALSSARWTIGHRLIVPAFE